MRQPLSAGAAGTAGTVQAGVKALEYVTSSSYFFHCGVIAVRIARIVEHVVVVVVRRFRCSIVNYEESAVIHTSPPFVFVLLCA